MQVYLVFVVLSSWKAKVFLSEGRPFIEDKNKTVKRHSIAVLIYTWLILILLLHFMVDKRWPLMTSLTAQDILIISGDDFDNYMLYNWW